MTEVVDTWSGTITWAPQPDLSVQSPEDAMNVLLQQAASLFGNEERSSRSGFGHRVGPMGAVANAVLVVECNGKSRDLPNLVSWTVSTLASSRFITL
ncbi:hypothetical protein QA641_36690 [Bradyrhizobium sp. CB1650]|uniref:hypothetical protein n=1 Tax=Bradyrhizobium sp. CB1650 TaxID=3039153 RepID=UPI002434F032|nr:hypothetical protein [Bradyrhizobium sp. CB1650]WGD51047.1 hypothetical protein QA641_36690 [Bradyrhizobium sp. CB1650]